MRKRGADGKFISTPKEERNGFLTEIRGFTETAYKIWRFLPLAILLLILWKYFQFSEKIIQILVEILCGNGCSCNCSKNTIVTVNEASASKNGI